MGMLKAMLRWRIWLRSLREAPNRPLRVAEPLRGSRERQGEEGGGWRSETVTVVVTYVTHLVVTFYDCIGLLLPTIRSLPFELIFDVFHVCIKESFIPPEVAAIVNK